MSTSMAFVGDGDRETSEISSSSSLSSWALGARWSNGKEEGSMGSYGIEDCDKSTFRFLFVAGVLIHLCEDIVAVELQLHLIFAHVVQARPDSKLTLMIAPSH